MGRLADVQKGADRVKDRIGNVLAKGDKVVLQLPDPMVFAYIVDVSEPSYLVRVTRPGHVIVSAVIALPAMEGHEDTIMQVAKVYDPQKASEPSEAPSEPTKLN